MALGYKTEYSITYDSLGKPYEEQRRIQGKPYFLNFRYVHDSTGLLVAIKQEL